MAKVYSDSISVWIVVSAEVAGQRYILLRHVTPKPETRFGADRSPEFYYGHVVTVSETNDKARFSFKKAAHLVQAKIPLLWPALVPALSSLIVNGTIPKKMFTEVKIGWGGRDNKGKIIRTACLHLDLGQFDAVDKLPKVLVLPGQSASFPKDSTSWGLETALINTNDTSGPNNGFYSQFFMTGTRRMRYQRTAGTNLQEAEIEDLRVQQTVALTIEKKFGIKFPAAPEGYTPNPRTNFLPSGP